MTRHLDAVVIGAGPAGLTAARVIAAAGLSCLAVDRMGPGGQLMNMGAVHDCPGLVPGVTGPELLSRLLDGAMAAGVELAVDEVTSLRPGIQDGAPWRLAAAEEPVTATAVVIATGLGRGNAAVDGEDLFEGLGISYCATCDGPLFMAKRVVVDGGDDWAVQEAIELAALAAHVTVVAEHGITAAPARTAVLTALPNIAVLTGRIAGIGGDPALTKVVVETSAGPVTLAARGLFPCARRKPATGFLDGLLRMTPNGYIQLGPGQQTSCQGIFACGDAASPAPSIAMAIADGDKAGQSAVRWVRSRVAGA